VVDGPGRYAEDCSCREELAADCDAASVDWNDAGKTERVGGVNAEGFIDYGSETALIRYSSASFLKQVALLW
jgi:hypothetical protein